MGFELSSGTLCLSDLLRCVATNILPSVSVTASGFTPVVKIWVVVNGHGELNSETWQT